MQQKPHVQTDAIKNTVRIHVPAEVSYDFEKMQKITANILDKLGCKGCHSGHILEFVNLREFVVDPSSLNVKEHIVGR